MATCRNRGVRVVIEGPDAVGKATQSAQLAEFMGGKVHAFPRYDTPTGKIIKAILREDIALGSTKGSEVFATEYAGLTEAEVEMLPHRLLQAFMTYDKYVHAGEISGEMLPLVFDRHEPSACVYGSLDGLPMQELLNAHMFMPAADVYILIDLPPEEQQRRQKARGRPTDKYEGDPGFLARARDTYLQFWRELGPAYKPHAQWFIVDGLGTPAEIQERIRTAVFGAERVVSQELFAGKRA